MFGQEIKLSLGESSHAGVYNTKPLRDFSIILWKTEIKGCGKQNCLIQDGFYICQVLSDIKTDQ